MVGQMSRAFIVSCLWFIVAAGSAWAHKPLFSEGEHADAEHALVVQDVGLSQVVYHTLTAEAPQCWLAFDAEKGQMLHFQIGVPCLERLQELRPTLVVLGPGLPALKGGPAVAREGLGGQVFETSDVEGPRRFHEPFTGTRSWILRKVEVEAPRAGRYYAVMCAPGAEPAKAWLAVGTREAFGLGDWLKLPGWIGRARRFHEVRGVPTWVAVGGGIILVVVACSP